MVQHRRDCFCNKCFEDYLRIKAAECVNENISESVRVSISEKEKGNKV